MDYYWRLTFRLPVRKPSSSSSDGFSQFKIQKTLMSDLIDHIRILSIGLELACNGG